MTFIAPPRPADLPGASSFFGRRAATPEGRHHRMGGEDGARRAFGIDGDPPAAALAGGAIEHLARIALG